MTTDSSTDFNTGATTGTDAGAADRAKGAASTAADQGRHVAGTAKAETLNVAGTAAEQARSVVGDAVRGVSDQVVDQATTQRDRLSETLRGLGDDLEKMASPGPGPESGLAVDLAHEVSERVRALGSHLEGREPSQLLDDARSFARRRPGTFLLGALAAGVVAGRLFRATADGAAAATLAEDSSPTYGSDLGNNLGNNLGSGLDGGVGFDGTGTPVPAIAEPDPYVSGYPTPETGAAPVMDPTVPVPPVSPVSGRPTLDTP
jgi:hypothetical protein